MTREQELDGALQRVRGRVADAARAADRDPDEITLVVVTKFFPASDVRLLHDLGVRDVGENRHQEAQAKVEEVGLGDLRWHYIGGLQSNKAAAVASYADAVHSLDRAKLLRGLSRGALEAGRVLPVTVQVDLDPRHAGGPDGIQDDGQGGGRAGALPQDVAALAAQVADTEGLELRGVMAVAPLDADPVEAFRRLQRVADEVRREHPGATWISAGMSGDLEAAIAFGATHVRVGGAVLGERPSRG